MKKAIKPRENKPKRPPELGRAVSDGRREGAQTSTALALQKTAVASISIPEDAARRLIPTLATKEADFPAFLMTQATSTSLPFGDSHRGFDNRFIAAAVRSLEPRDGLEALLAVQMVRTHNQALEYMDRAASKTQTAFGVELFTNFANRLLRTFTAQVEALKTYRTKGEQKVEVKHVHVHRGGQAIVGPVRHTAVGGGDDNKKQQ